MARVGFGVVGLRGIGQTHIESILEAEDAELVAVCDIVEPLARVNGERYGVKWFTRYTDMLEEPEVEVVCICTPPYLHREMAVEAFKHGKHVLCEKPMALTVGEADEMILEAERRKVKLGVAFQYRTSSLSQKGWKIVREGRLGQLLRATLEFAWYRTSMYYKVASWRSSLKKAGGGVLMNQAIHLIDILQWLVGKPRRVLGITATRLHDVEVEDIASAIVLFEDEVQAVIQASLIDSVRTTKITVSGTKGKMVLDYEKGKFRLGCSSVDLRSHLEESEEEWGNPRFAWIESTRGEGKGSHTFLIKDFMEALREDRKPMVSGEDALWSLEIVNAVIMSNTLGKPVDIPVNRTLYDRIFRKLSGEVD